MLKVKDDSEDAIKMKLDAIEILKEEQQKTIQNIKAASEFNRIRDSEHSNKLFFAHTKARVKQNKVPHLKNPDGSLTVTVKEKKCAVSREYQQTFTKRVPDPHALQKVIIALQNQQKKLSSKRKKEIEDFTNINELDPDPSEGHGAKDWLLSAIESIKMYKAPGPDGIPNDFYFIFRKDVNMRDLGSASVRKYLLRVNLI